MAERLVTVSFLQAKWDADQARQLEAQNKLDLYRDDYEDIIKAAMKNLFHKDNYERLKYHVNQSQNILKRVVNEISMVYKVNAKRTLDKESLRYEELKKEMNFDFKLKKVNRYTNLLNELILKIGTRGGKLVYDVLTPNICTVIQDENDPTRARAIIYSNTLVNTVGSPLIEYYYWDDMGNYQILNKDKLIKKVIYAPGDYPYRDAENLPILPFVVFHRQEPDDTFWDQDTGRDLYNAAILTGVKMTLFDYYFKTASFKQIYAIGDKVDVPSGQVLDPLTVFTASGQGAAVGTLDLQIDMDKLVNALVFQINSIINNYGISADAYTLSVAEMSGRALKIKNRALLELRQDQEPLYRNAEQELFEKTRIINNAHAPRMGWGEIPGDATLELDFGEIEFPEDPKDELEFEKARLKTGIISLGQFYQHFNPDVTDEVEAEKAIIKNLEALGKLREAHPTLDEALNYIMKNAGQPGQEKGTENPFAGEVK
jgi:hypothetical protein